MCLNEYFDTMLWKKTLKVIFASFLLYEEKVVLGISRFDFHFKRFLKCRLK